MDDHTKAFGLGVFILITLGVTTWLLLFLHPGSGDCGHILHVRFANIESISIGTRVTFGGKPVGVVKQIHPVEDFRSHPTLANGSYLPYELDLCVDSKVRIYNYDEIGFATSGLLGERSIAILPKAAPPGAPPPYEITDQVMVGRSSDDMQEAMKKIQEVASTFTGTLNRVNEFLDANQQLMHQTLVSIKEAASHFGSVMSGIEHSGLIETFAYISRGEGSLGKLIYSDHLYLYLTAVFRKLEVTLSDINNYGLLFQFDKKWQRKRMQKEWLMQQLGSPKEALGFFNEQVMEIGCQVDRLNRLLYDKQDCFEESKEAATGLRELLQRVDDLQEHLQGYQEIFVRCQQGYVS